MINILFVCLGNICRSPMAEYFMKTLVEQEGLDWAFHIESAATSREELGNAAYPPARRELQKHGIDCSGHRARQLQKADYQRFDYLIGMDRSNISNMLRLCGGDPDGKICRLLEYTDRPGDVADPWYTGDFQATWRDVSQGCAALLALLRERHGL